MLALAHRGGWRMTAGFMLSALTLWTSPASGEDAKVDATPLTFKVAIPGNIAAVRDALTSALEGQNYMIVNTLNVQEALENRDIAAEPIQLVEFINLTKAYAVTQSNARFELFAPLRAALFQDKDKVIILILRPRFIEATLGASGLSAQARATLEDFDDSLRQVLETVASGGF
jgi:uncharacterized protein (DUF302 family)